MGDTTLNPQRTASILKELEHAARSVDEARRELIQAMADRRRDRPTRSAPANGPVRRKPR